MFTITSIEFGILSKKDIKNLSVCEITNPKLNAKNTENSVYDPRLGTMDCSSNCQTCLLSISECTGHFGHMKFARHFINPLFKKYVIALLRCICHSCTRILFKVEYINTIINPDNNLTDDKLFSAIREKAKKIRLCSWCGFMMPLITYDQIADVIKCDEKIIEERAISKILKISDDDAAALGFNPSLVRPRDMVANIFPIIPPCARPFIVADENVCDDDITARYLEFLRINEHIAKNGEDVGKYLDTLKFKIKTFIDNSNNKSKYPKGRPIKSIKQRITGKKSLIRNNIIGKRVEQSGRTVIGPGPTLKLSQVGVPREFARVLTFPEHVNQYNLEKLEKLVNCGAAEKIVTDAGRTLLLKYALYNRGTMLMYGDIVLRGKLRIMITPQNFNQRRYEDKPNQCIDSLGNLRDTDFIQRDGKIINVTPWSKKYVSIRPGFIVYRYIQDGDICLINRQPTLHKGSMMAYEIILHNQKNITFNLASTKSFNADYDGDEINIHVPQSYVTALELRELIMATKQIISSRSSGQI